MKHVKKLCLCLSVIMLLSVFAACTPEDADETQAPIADITTEAITESPTEASSADKPTEAPTETPTTEAPTETPTTETPTEAPTETPTTETPAEAPTETPTTETPTEAPTEAPTTETPTEAPTEAPTSTPTEEPTTEEPTEEPTEASTEPETEEETTVSPYPEIEQRYFIYRIWNFNMLTLEQFKSIADTVVLDGFNAIKVHIPWFQAEKEFGKYDFAAFDAMINYAVNEKGLKVAVSIDLTRKSGDGYLEDADLMRDSAGNICAGGYPFDRTQMSFNSTNATYKAVRFYKNAVAHYDELFGENILFYLPAFSQYAESEFWPTAEYDYSNNAKNAFRKFLETEYGTIEEFNRVCGTSFTAFSEVEPPSASAADNLGELWYIFRHNSLKSLIDRLADAQKKEAPNSKFALQFGCVYDEMAFRRVTLGFADLCENADVVWVDDGPTMDHLFSMDLLTSNLPAHVELGQEIDGPTQVGASKENYLKQGMLCFKRGATYVSIANWSIELGADNYNNYRNIWKQIAERWLGENAPEVTRPDDSSPVLDVHLSTLFKMHNISSVMSTYTALSEGSKPVRINWIDDLTDSSPKEPSEIYSFPGGFSSTQGDGGWYYKSYSNGEFSDMTYNEANGQWEGEHPYTLILNGVMHPDTSDSALIFKAEKDGELTISINVYVRDYGDTGDGILFTVLHNQTPTDILRQAVVYGSSFTSTLTITMKAGDELAFIVNKNSGNAFDSTAVSVFIESK